MAEIPQITEEPDGDLKIAPTHRKPTGIAAWLGEDFSMGMMLAGAAMTAALLFSGGTPLSVLLLGEAGKGAVASLLVSLGVMGTGGLIGGFVNKLNTEKQAEEGITVKKPSFLNRGILTEGLLKGGLNGMMLATLGMALVGGVGGMLFAPLKMFSVAGLAAKFGAMIPVAIAGVAAAIGAVRGSFARKEQMEQNYNQVKTAYYIQRGEPEKARGLMRRMGLAPAVAAGLGRTAAGMSGTGMPQDSGVGNVLGDQTSNPYDFSYMENHPAASARRSFVQAENERAGARGQEFGVAG